MRYINIRQYVRNINEETQNLPVTVTKFGRPIFVVSADGTIPATPEVIKEMVAEVDLAAEGIRCLAPNVNCKEPAKYLVTYENPETLGIETNPYCETHFKWLSKTCEIIKEEELNAVS